MLLSKKKKSIKISDVIPTKMISLKGKSTTWGFTLFKNGINKKVIAHVRSVPKLIARPKKPNKVFTAEVLQQIKRDIDENKKLEESKSKVIKPSSSFLSISRNTWSSAVAQSYIPNSKSKVPSVTQYTPRNITLSNQPNYSFSKNKRDTTLFLFAERPGSIVLPDMEDDRANFERHKTSRENHAPTFYRSSIKIPDLLKQNFARKRKSISSCKSRRKLKNLKNLELSCIRTNSGTLTSRPKTAMVSIELLLPFPSSLTISVEQEKSNE